MKREKLSWIRSAACRFLCAAVLVTAACLCLAGQAYAESNFVIDEYDIDMQVNPDDTYLITETIDVHFTAPSHGIYREVPYRVHLDRDGQTDTFYGRVRDFTMLSGQPADEERRDNSYFFRIGDEDSYADPDTTYRFSYVFDMRGDHLKGADEVYYNLVGTGWEAQAIRHTTFTVTFPEKIDMSRVGVKNGGQVSIPFQTEGERIVRCDTREDVLGGLTIRAVLPEGYFTKQARSDLLFWILAALLAAATGCSAVIWRKHGRDPAIVETEEFYPPEGLSAPEVGYLESGEITGEHVISLLLTLADKGYVRIEEHPFTKDHKRKRDPSYTIRKLKEYDGDSEDERIFMQGLFEKDADTADMIQLEDRFYKTVDEIKEAIEERYEGKLFEENADTWAWLFRVIGFFGMVALFVISKLINGSPFLPAHGEFIESCGTGLMEIVLPIAGFHGIAAWINRPRKDPVKFALGFAGWGLLIAAGFGLAVIFDTCMGAQIPPYLVGLGALFLLFLMAALCEKKTDEYARLLGKLRGYKRFLQVAEKDRMEMLAGQDPGYFYRNLAFAFALGVTSVYVKRFAELAKKPPEWFDSPLYTPGAAFDHLSWMLTMGSMMSGIGDSMMSSPSDSGGGGSFFGGGGAGGGGGGSW